MNSIYTSRICSYLKFFATCLLLVGLALKPGKSTAQCTSPGVVTVTSPTNISCSSFLANWNTPSGTVTNYVVELASDPGFFTIIAGPFETGSITTSYSFTGLTAGASYYFRIMAVDSVSPTSVCYSSAWSTLTGASIANLLAPSATCQCTPVNDLTCATDYISNVTVNTLNNSSSCSTGGYSFYFPTGSQTTNLAIANTYTLSVSTGGGNPGVHGAGVWFDFNQNSSLLDAGEFFLVSNVATTGSTISKSITIPASATPGYTAMRVRYGISETMVQSDACTMLPNTTDGETEDYTVCLYVPTNISLLPQNTLACVGSTPVLFLGATGSGLTYQWYTNTTNTNTGGTIISGATNSNYTPGPPVTTTPGTYYYYCVLTNICGTSITTPSSSAAALTINPTPTVASISATPAVLCVGNPLTLIGSGATGIGIPTYNWQGPNGYTAVTASDTSIYTPISIAASGIYSLTVVYPGAGCTSNQVISSFVTVNDSPSVANITATPSPLCTGSTITLTAGATTGAGTISSYNWSGPNGYSTSTTTSSTSLTASTLAASGKYVLTVTYPGAGCYSASDTSSFVEVDTAAAAITGNAVICYQGSTIFSNTTPVGSGTGWSSSNAGVATIDPVTGVVTTTGSAGGTTNIVYEVINSCGTTISSVVLTVNPLPSSITGNIAVCNGLGICLSDPTPLGTWSSSNGNVSINGSTGCVTGLFAGTSVITYTLPTGCITTVISTVNPLPANISGNKNVCLNLTTSLSDATAGGSWSSSDVSIGTIGTNGIVTGLSVGTTGITYTLPTGCIISTVVTVNPLPDNITGINVVCATQTTSLADQTPGGIWLSSSNLQATVGTGGIVTGVSAGIPTITYQLPTGCIATIPVTVNPLSAILGSPAVCIGLTATISDVTPGGTWSSSNTTVADIGSTTGVITGNNLGTATITYLIAPTGCAAYTTTTVNPLPSGISGGNAPLCAGTTLCLTDASTGGTWSSSNTAVATVGGTSGCVTGGSGVLVASTVTITYTLPTGCTTNTTITVNPIPVPITGTPEVCIGLSTCLTDLTPGGTWSTSNATVATIGSTGCITTGTSSGTVNITYSIPTGCNTTSVFTVNPLPTNILGSSAVCSGSTIILSDAGGGTWSTGDITVSVNSTTGAVTGIAAGPATATITYTLPTSCITTQIITINPLPVAITGISDTVCLGLTISFSDADGTGTWSTTNANASIGSTGILTGLIAGTSTISYTIPTGCAATQIITVNPLPGTITGPLNVCLGLTTTLNSIPATGTWSSSNPSMASVDAISGIVTGNANGTAVITYTLPTGCITTAVITVNPNPPAISFLTPNSVCPGSTISLSDGSSGGTWYISTSTIATIGSLTGIVTGVSGGTATATYVTSAGCISTAIVTINPAPATISGAPNICLGSISGLSDTPTGGTWSSSNTSVGTIGSSSGIITSLSTGTSVISYTLPTTCATSLTVTVVSAVAAITGTTNVCIGLTTTLSDATIGGSWSSSSPAIGSVDPISGIVTGLTAGTANIIYTLGTTGCIATTTITVNPLPGNILGPNNVCSGSTITLSDAPTGGAWSSSNTAIATIGSSSGIATGGIVGIPSTWISTYTLSTGCIATAVITVNPLPSAITGPNVVCSGTTIPLSDVSSGGTWVSSNTAVAIVGSSTGIVTGQGVSAGTATISYILPTGCYITTVVSVIVTINPITGTATNCPQFPINLNDATSGGTWSSSNTAVGTVSSTGIVTDITPGTATITYSLGGVCAVTKVVTFNTVPAITGNTDICYASTSNLHNTTLGGTWSSTNPTVATIGSSSGLVTSVSTGTTVISYILAGGCNTTTTVTIVSSLPNILGTLSVCKGLGTSLSDGVITGGTWTSSNTAIATIGSSSGLATGVNAGSATISYKLGTGCTSTAGITVNPNPAAISGPTAVCQSSSITANSITLSDGTPGGTWSASSVTLTSASTITTVTATSAGTYTVAYTLSATGCAAYTNITVNPTPASIAGPSGVCYLSGVVESDATGGGTWGSSNTSVVYVSAGATFGVALGTANITYQVATTGCAVTKVITVNPVPSGIVGIKTVCAGSTTTLSDALAGGTWISDDATVASINSFTGVLTGVSAGTANITYTSAAGCTTDTIVTVLETPGPILGTPAVCSGGTTTLSDTTAGGTWSSTTIIIDPAGNVTGNIVGTATFDTATIDYTTSNGCYSTINFYSNPFPAAITGTTSVCPGLTTVLSSPTTGGTWSSSNNSVATINGSTGVVTGISTGTAIITYINSSGCFVTTTVNVFSTVGPITASSSQVCVGLSLNLDDTSSGTWSVNNSNAIIGSVAGIITGESVGGVTATLTASSGCIATANFTVINSIPSITGTTFSVCPGFTITLSDATAGGNWSSSSPNISVGSATGVVTGINAGTATITYALGAGCTVTTTVTVNGQPITGITTICVGSSTTLTDVESGGTWSSTSSNVFVGSSSGIITGVISGPAPITYSSPLGCIITTTVSVLNYVPTLIASPSVLCVGLTSNLLDAYSGGTWSSSNTSIASVGSNNGILTGIAAGTVTITYTIGTGCNTTSVLTVNPLSPILGNTTVCNSATTNLSDTTTGGTWTSSNADVTIGSSTGIVTAVTPGTATITYALSTGCSVTTTVTVNPIAPINGITSICNPGTTTLSDNVTGGTWSSSNTAVGTVDPNTGIVSSLSAGTTLITYTLLTGCTASTTVVVVSSLPAITGNTNDCIGAPSILSNAISGGTWSSNDITIATVDPISGSVTGVAADTTTISYMLGTGCTATTLVTINSLPAAITGSVFVCVGLTNTLVDDTTGGNWSSSNTSIASVGSTGIVTGLSAGMANITYATPAGCIATTVATVNPLPLAISGIINICPTSTTTLSDATTGGTWSSSNTGTGTIDPNTGVVTALAAGTSAITYTLPTGCIVTTTLNVVNTITPITGILKACTNTTTSLSDALAGGAWSASNSNASVDPVSGIVTGLITGTTSVVYTLGTGCSVSAVVTINPAPSAILGTAQVCLGAATTLSDITTPGTWSASNSNATIGSGTGLVHGVTVGIDTIKYTINNGCSITGTFTVNALPTAYLVNGGGSYCGGGIGVNIILDSSNTGINYTLYQAATSITTLPGTGDTVNFGPQTVAGAYTVLATNATTGCTSRMLDSAVVSITTPLIPLVNISTASDTVCAGTYTTFFATSVNGGTLPGYQWLVNGVSPGADSNHYSYIPVNGDVVSVILTSNAICVSPDTAITSIVMTVNNNKLPGVGISIFPGDTLCAGALATFSAVDSFGGTAPVFNWFKNSIYAGTGSTFSFTPYIPDNGDIIYCKMTSNYACVTTDTVSSSYIQLVIDSSLIPVITLNATPGITILQGQSDTITATVVNGGISPTFQWLVNGVPVSGDTTNVFISDTLSNNDSVTCIVRGSGECGLYTFNSAIIITDGKLNVQQITAGNSDLRLVPNPNNGSFTVKGTLATTLDEEVSVEITDMLGQVIYKNKIMAVGGRINEQIQLNSKLANGMYTLSLHAENENKVFHLVIEQ